MTPRELAERIAEAIDDKWTEFNQRTGKQLPATYQVVFPIIEQLVRELCEENREMRRLLLEARNVCQSHKSTADSFEKKVTAALTKEPDRD